MDLQSCVRLLIITGVGEIACYGRPQQHTRHTELSTRISPDAVIATTPLSQPLKDWWKQNAKSDDPDLNIWVGNLAILPLAQSHFDDNDDDQEAILALDRGAPEQYL
jgi:hypothetical protein